MHVYILFAHPHRRSFSGAVLEAFTRGLRDGGHTYEVGDLYEMGFRSEMDADQYNREVGRDTSAPVPADVQREQEKVNAAGALAFVYPVWWSDCPAKLQDHLLIRFSFADASCPSRPHPQNPDRVRQYRRRPLPPQRSACARTPTQPTAAAA